MLVKLKEEDKKFDNWQNEFDSDQNAFVVLGIQSQGGYIEINGKKITVIEFEYFYIRLNVTDKNISVYKKKGFKDKMLETPEYLNLIQKIIKYGRKKDFEQLFR
jgi:hypothetical protein